MIRWAVQNEYLEANPLDGVAKPAEETVGDRVLSEDEIHVLWEALPTALASEQRQRVVKLCLITAQRIGEVTGMASAELDLKAREWRLPGHRTKNGHAHLVPLSDLAIEIIREAMDDTGKAAAIFPCGDGSLSPVNVGNTIRQANVANRFGIPPWSANDSRRSALTGMARLGVAPIVLGHIANHRTMTCSGVTLSVYSHYEYSAEKRAALDLMGGATSSHREGRSCFSNQVPREGAPCSFLNVACKFPSGFPLISQPKPANCIRSIETWQLRLP